DQQTERFFRVLDAEIARYHTAPTNQPLVLAGLPENQALFRSVSQNGRLVEAERQVPGNIDRETGRVEMHDEASSVRDDLLDDIAEKVLRSGGEVVMVPSERMPPDSGLAAIYRY